MIYVGHMASSYGGTFSSVRRKVFVSDHHRQNQRPYGAFHDSLEILADNSLERRINSAHLSYYGI
jgi:hypothetical protein